METDRELPKYFVQESSPRLFQISESEIKMEIVLKRRLTSETMKTFFPSLLLVCFSFATSFFRLPNFFNTAITANLTVMLTMTTLMGSVLNRLPETSYIKWIEFWLIFTQFVPFAQVILITIIEAWRHREEVNEKRQRQEDTEEIVMERSPEVYEMIVEGKKVKVEAACFFCL